MPADSTSPRRFYEFFAGGGLARLGLGPAWTCLFANDIDPAKAQCYRAAFGEHGFYNGDVWAIDRRDLPLGADLAWASFPCQDLSLAGARRGLSAPRSGAFWGFWRLIESLGEDRPIVLALENVAGLVTSRGGGDFAAVCGALAAAGYRAGALTIDASLFLPQSRPRVFIIAARRAIPAALTQPGPAAFHSAALVRAVGALAPALARQWVWWRLPRPPLRNIALADLLEPDEAVTWRREVDTARLLELMAARQRAQVQSLITAGGRHVGAAFRRIRVEDGAKVQRVEARFDGLAGCLRTPTGGSSRQTVLVLENGAARSRLFTPRECARLMGAPDDYPLPASTNSALHLMGDAVAAPAVRWLSEHLLTPLVEAARQAARAA